ncbi:MAG: histidine kinase [Candidatus Tectimicrobiota bacterium]|nr:MAG: histidine kinase [Candidatus Tectomicrobia bacterium]
MGLALWQTLALLERAATEQLTATEQALFSLLQEASRPALLTGDYAELQLYLEQVQRNPYVRAAVVADHRQRIVASTEASLLGAPLARVSGDWHRAQLRNAAASLGTVAVAFSRAPMQQALQRARDAGIHLALGGLAALAAAGLATGFVLTRRLHRLARAAARLAAGDWQVAAALPGSDEVARLGRTFDAMVRELAADRARLQEARAQLEQQLHAQQRIEQALRQRVAELAALTEVGQALTASRDPQAVLELVVEHARRLLRSERAGLAVVECEGGEGVLRFVAVRGLSEDFRRRLRPRHWRDGTTARAIAERRPVWSADLLNDPAFELTPHTRAMVAAEGYRAVLSVPLLRGEEALGALVVYRDAAGPFAPEEVELLQLFAAQAAVALENAQLFANLRQLNAALRDSEARYRTLVEASIQGIVIHHDYMIRFANPAAARIFGYDDPRQLLGQDVRRFMAPHERPRLEGYRDARLRGEPVPSRFEWQGVRQDGTPIWLETVASVVTWEGQPAILGTLLDISERKRLEAQLLQAQKMEAIGTLAGGIAHDFNNILAAILGYAELALFDVPEGSPLWCNVQEILTAGRRGRDLVRQILAFSRQRPPQRQPVRLRPLVQEALTLLRASLPSTVELRLRLEAEADTVLADPTQLQQVLMNLCTNAEHAMRPAGGVLEIGLDTVAVTPEFAAAHPPLRPGAHLRLRVRDSGCGMPPEVVSRIFDPFFTTKAPGEGTGMGLAVVHGIVTGHGGAITVESAPGQGTTFDVYLPPADPAPAAAAAAAEPLPQGRGRILFVDDEPALAQLGQELLSHLGYQVTAYTSSREALAAFRAAPQDFDLVITDQTMPQLTGEALVQELRRLRPDLPIILCTGFSHTLSEAKVAALGLQGFLYKPLVASELAAAVQRALAAPVTG